MRTFHLGGAVSRYEERSSAITRHSGTVRLDNVRTVTGKEGIQVVMNKNGRIVVLDDTGREREHYTAVYGAKLYVKHGQRVSEGTKLAEWDLYTIPILTEHTGRVRFEDIIDGITLQEMTDEVTKKTSRVIIESKNPDIVPRIIVEPIDESEQQPQSYMLPSGSILTVDEGEVVFAGEPLAKRTRETTKTKDITGGLPRVAELFEARKPKEQAIVSEIDGVVSFSEGKKGKRKVTITPPVGNAVEYQVPKGRHLMVREGEQVKAGEPLMEGSINPHDILRIKGKKELAKYLVNAIQEVYRAQHVNINDKHIEVIVRQMLKKVKIKDAGDTQFIPDSQVSDTVFEEENRRVTEKGGKPAVAEPLLLGITKAALATDSFVSASSFQETTRVLTEASINGKVDHLRGLKENVIMGRLIPAGTGLSHYRDVGVEVSEKEVEAEMPPTSIEEVAKGA
jgi:DNA-directed RNA polymerase subunit beta'